MPPTTRRMSRIHLTHSPPSPTMLLQPPASSNSQHDIDTGTPPTPTKLTGVDTPAEMSDSHSRSGHEDMDIDEVTAALHREDSEEYDQDEEDSGVEVDNGEVSGEEGHGEGDGEGEDSGVRINMQGDKLYMSAGGAGSSSDDEDEEEEAEEDEDEGEEEDDDDEKDEEDEEQQPIQQQPPGYETVEDAKEDDQVSAPRRETTSAPPRSLANRPSPSPSAPPNITVTPSPSATYSARSRSPSYFVPPAPPPPQPSSTALIYQYTQDDTALNLLHGPKVTYICGGVRPIIGRDGLPVGCQAEQEKRRGESLKCKECGSPVMYKVRTKRMVQFEAR